LIHFARHLRVKQRISIGAQMRYWNANVLGGER
jgi:hypothetical protein